MMVHGTIVMYNFCRGVDYVTGCHFERALFTIGTCVNNELPASGSLARGTESWIHAVSLSPFAISSMCAGLSYLAVLQRKARATNCQPTLCNTIMQMGTHTSACQHNY